MKNVIMFELAGYHPWADNLNIIIDIIRKLNESNMLNLAFDIDECLDCIDTNNKDSVILAHEKEAVCLALRRLISEENIEMTYRGKQLINIVLCDMFQMRFDYVVKKDITSCSYHDNEKVFDQLEISVKDTNEVIYGCS
jgi:hypothetical protein